MFCRNCGQQLDDTATVCTNCGHETGVVAAAKTEEVFYCKNCGKQINPEKAFCPYCGAEKGAAAPQQAAQPAPAAPVNVNLVNNTPAVPDAPNMGFAVLGFFFPLIGLILWLIWKDQTPLKAKSCGKGALVGVIVSVVSYVFIYIFYFALLIGMSGLSALPFIL